MERKKLQTMFGAVRSSRHQMRMHAHWGWGHTSGPAASEGIALHEQGHALHQPVDAVSESIRPRRLQGHARRGKHGGDSFVGLPQHARHALLVSNVSRVLGTNLPAESWHPVGIGQLQPVL